jgi:O-antigen/teichoic acid export membrane protein
VRINNWLSIAVIISAIVAVIKAYLKPRIDDFYTLGNVIYSGIIILSIVLGIVLSRNISDNNVVFVISIGVFAASVVSLIYYSIFFYKQFTDIRYSVHYETQDSQAKFWQLIVYLFKNSMPYLLLYSAVPLYRLFDIYVLQWIIPAETVIVETTIYQFKVFYIVMVPVVLLTMLGNTYTQRIGKDFAVNNLSGVEKNINRAIHMVLYFGLPVTAFVMLFSDQIYRILFDSTDLLLTTAPFIVLLPLMILTSRMINMISKTGYLWYSLSFGFLIKLLTTYALSIYIGTHGAIIATHLGLLATIAINIIVLNGITMFEIGYLFKRVIYIVGATALMSGVLYFVDRLLVTTLDYTMTLGSNLLFLLISLLIAVVLYFVMSLYTGLIQIVTESDLTWWDLYDQIEEWEDDELLW